MDVNYVEDIYVGYRYYDLAGEEQAYPFGHGLSYNKVTYSSLSVKGNTVNIELKNYGKTPTVEIAQVYLKKLDSAVLRPEKELCGFARVSLKAGETKTVEIPFTVPCVYDTERGVYVQEAGAYVVYVGASVLDIKQSKQIKLSGEALSADDKIISNYIHSRTNIFSDNYKLEAKVKAMIEQFDGIELPWGKVNGAFIVSENMADNGGMSVTLDIMKETEGASYEEYFKNWARVWCQKARPEFLQLLLTVDVHGPASLRANMPPRNFPEWYAAFNVKKTDGMYLAPSKRVVIW